MNFASDNTAAIAPGILKAIAAVNEGFVLGYGNDPITRDVEKRLSDLFRARGRGFLVPTGTAANALALAHVTPPWSGVLCHANAHIMTDECGAPEFFGAWPEADRPAGRPRQAAGSRPSPRRSSAIPGIRRIRSMPRRCRSRRRPKPARSIAWRRSKRSRRSRMPRGLKVHMDGARFLNALARMNVGPAEATWKAGVDVLSFGATKGGAMAAEAVVFFDPAVAAMMPERRKRARASVLQAPLPCGAIRGVPQRRLRADARAPRQRHGRPPGGAA